VRAAEEWAIGLPHVSRTGVPFSILDVGARARDPQDYRDVLAQLR
jgi:hypothetical protein